MASVLPHSTVLRRESALYLDDVETLAKRTVNSVRSAAAFRSVYKVVLATDTVLGGIAGARQRPKLSTLRAVLRRVPLLVSLAQISGAAIELRRIIELCFWTVYFTEHPREWTRFTELPSHGIARADADPLTWAACREPSYYRQYAREVLRGDPSGLAREAVDRLGVQYGNISEVVHPARLTVGGRIPPVLESHEERDLQASARQIRAVCSGVVLVLAAVSPNRFNRLGPVPRAWFDWLVGTPTSRRLRAGPFGLGA